MPGSDFSYLLRSVPRSIAAAYLNCCFGCHLPQPDNASVSLLFSYYSDPLPVSFIDAAAQFSSFCFLFNGKHDPCFVALMDIKERCNLFSWSREQVCTQLRDDLEQGFNVRKPAQFKIRDQIWREGSPKIMGIVNITPDSFYDGGKYFKAKDYGTIAAQLIEEGADIIDVGGESSRPGSKPVSAHEELNRVLPVIQQIRRRFSLPISVDTVKPEVADVVLSNGADMINDVSGLAAGQKMIDVLSRAGASYCLMHIQGTPANMQQNPTYNDVVAEVYRFFQTKLKLCSDSGIEQEKICLDPGIGFGKNLGHNLSLLRFFTAFLSLNQVLLLGTSNKSFIGQILNKDTHDREAGSLASQVMGLINGATVFRVHQVQSASDAIRMASVYTKAGETLFEEG